MKIDELIDELEQVKEKHGNLEVRSFQKWGTDEKVECFKRKDAKDWCGLWLD